jgi:hypothetical protein
LERRLLKVVNSGDSLRTSVMLNLVLVAAADEARVRRRKSVAVAALRGAMVAEVRTGSAQGRPVG